MVNFDYLIYIITQKYVHHFMASGCLKRKIRENNSLFYIVTYSNMCMIVDDIYSLTHTFAKLSPNLTIFAEIFPNLVLALKISP